MLRVLITIAVLVAALPAFADPAPDQCHLKRVAVLDMTTGHEGTVTVPLSVGGETLAMTVDTGGIVTMLSPRVADKLKLERHTLYDYTLHMVGGTKINQFVEAPSFQFGPFHQDSRQLMIAPGEVMADGEDGILAPDILRNFDVDFDFAGGKMTLFSQDHCPGRVLYWTEGEYAVIPFHFDEGHIALTVEIDGKNTTAILDTGSTSSVIGLEFAKHKFGLADSPDLKPVENSPVAGTMRYPFKAVKFGGVTVLNPNIVLLPDKDHLVLSDDVPAIIGMTVLRRLHLYIAYGEMNLYITPADQH